MHVGGGGYIYTNIYYLLHFDLDNLLNLLDLVDNLFLVLDLGFKDRDLHLSWV